MKLVQEAIRKSAVLIEALPYIKAYSGKIVVIKYGGSALINPEIKKRVLQDIVFMSYVGIRPVIVHGGGPFINEELKKLDIKVEFKDGLRVSTKEVVSVVDKVLSRVNLDIVKDIKDLGGRAISLNTAKKDVIKATSHKNASKLGFVGEVEEVYGDVIRKVIRPRSIPVISPLGLGEDNELYNVNADEVSCEVAIALKAAKLVLLTDVKGIMREKGNEDTLISTLTVKEVKTLVEQNVIQSGMIPKVSSCIKALNGGVSKIHIIDGRIQHSLLLEIFTDKGIGTEIIKGKE